MAAAVMDEDGRVRTGTVWTAAAHAVTAVIGSGVLAVPWSVAQMGWIFGPVSLVGFAVITYITARLLSDCYRSPDPVKGERNHTYIGAVQAILGKKHVVLCVFAQYAQLWGTMVGYTITAVMSMMSIERSHCYHTAPPDTSTKHCEHSHSNTKFMFIFGVVQVLLSQFPSLSDISILSVIAATMSFGYSFIALYLCTSKFTSSPKLRGTLTGIPIGNDHDHELTVTNKMWNTLQALGNIAFSYTYSQLLVEIQDTLKSPPSENKTMKRATLYSIGTTTIFYFTLGIMGYLSFGNDTPGNILTAFNKPFWLVDLANFGVILHLTAAFQVFGQPIYASYENLLSTMYPSSLFIHKTYTIPMKSHRRLHFTLCRLLLRPVVVVVTILTAMMFPFFNAVLGLLGSIAFWPLTVYLPVTMYMTTQSDEVKRGGVKWVSLHGLSLVSLVVSLASGIGSVADIVEKLRHAKLFGVES